MKFLHIIILTACSLLIARDGISAQITTLDLDTKTSPASTLGAETDSSHDPAQAASMPIDSSHLLVREAAHWANYKKSLRNHSSQHMASAEELESAMMDFARYDGARIAKGWMADSALIALQTPEYFLGVRYWQNTYGRKAVLDRLHQNPMAAFQFPGAEQAQNAILRSGMKDANEIKLGGALFKEQAYSMQKQSWANKKQGGKNFRLDAIKLAPNSPAPLDNNDLQMLASSAMSLFNDPNISAAKTSSFASNLSLGPSAALADTFAPGQDLKLAPGRSLTMAHILGMAALVILDDPQEPSNKDQHFQYWIDDPELRECIDWSRVHLRQCVSAGHFVFESSFCIAEHQLIDAGKCIGSIAAGNKDPHQQEQH